MFQNKCTITIITTRIFTAQPTVLEGNELQEAKAKAIYNIKYKFNYMSKVYKVTIKLELILVMARDQSVM